MIDLLVDQGIYTAFKSPKLSTNNTHGSGDTLSAAIAAWLALGLPLIEAVAKAGHFTHTAIKRAANWKMGQGHGPVGQHKLQLRQR